MTHPEVSEKGSPQIQGGISDAAKAKANAMLVELRHQDDCTMSAYHTDQCGCGLCEATIELARFIQEVSDAAKATVPLLETWVGNSDEAGKRAAKVLAPFILPEDRDPLEAALKDANENGGCTYADWAKALPEALAKRGLQSTEASVMTQIQGDELDDGGVGAMPDGPGCQPTASAASASSQSGIPIAVTQADRDLAIELLAFAGHAFSAQLVLEGAGDNWGDVQAIARHRQRTDAAAFNAGYLIAVANIMNLHGEDTIAEDVLLQLGVRERVLSELDLSDYDTKPLRKLFREIARKERAA